MRKVLDINEVWSDLLDKILRHGIVECPREIKTVELLHNQTTIDMNQPVLSVKERNMGYRFMCAEAWWILSGQNTVKTIAPYSKAISKFSDNGITFAGAYGPKIVDQLQYIVECFEKDLSSRQAVLNIWRENPRESKDIPCTISAQFIIRNGVLHCIDTMRSSDAWLGWVYDVFNFSCLSMWIVIALRLKGINVELGTLTLQAGSQHLYETNWEEADDISEDFSEFDVAPVDLSEFDHPSDLVQYLKDIADYGKDSYITTHWLKELPHIEG